MWILRGMEISLKVLPFTTEGTKICRGRAGLWSVPHLWLVYLLSEHFKLVHVEFEHPSTFADLASRLGWPYVFWDKSDGKQMEVLSCTEVFCWYRPWILGSFSFTVKRLNLVESEGHKFNPCKRTEGIVVTKMSWSFENMPKKHSVVCNSFAKILP